MPVCRCRGGWSGFSVIWPFSITGVWPWLLGACAIGSYWNWRAAILLAIPLLLTRGVGYFGLSNALVASMLSYSIAAAVAVFWIDWVAGLFLAIIGLLDAFAIFGVLPVFSALVAAEIAFVAGVVISAYLGPSGGIPWHGASGRDSGRDHHRIGVAPRSGPPET